MYYYPNGNEEKRNVKNPRIQTPIRLREITLMMIKFDESFPVHTETLTNVDELNGILEDDIRTAGDSLGMRNPSAQCMMTRWDMHEQSKAFRMLGNAAIGLAQLLPLATRTNEDGTQNPVNYKVSTSWGLIYGKVSSPIVIRIGLILGVGRTASVGVRIAVLWSLLTQIIV